MACLKRAQQPNFTLCKAICSMQSRGYPVLSNQHLQLCFSYLNKTSVRFTTPNVIFHCQPSMFGLWQSYTKKHSFNCCLIGVGTTFSLRTSKVLLISLLLQSDAFAWWCRALYIFVMWNCFTFYMHFSLPFALSFLCLLINFSLLLAFLSFAFFLYLLL